MQLSAASAPTILLLSILACGSTRLGDGCLFAAETDAQRAGAGIDLSQCNSDPLSLGRTTYVAESKQVYGIASVQVRFRGCSHAVFATERHARMDGSRTYDIYYPTAAGTVSESYRAPIVHELGHVLQEEKYGAPEALLDKLDGSMARVELGADFLAGVVYQRLWKGQTDTFEFTSDIQLLGSFHSTDPQFHGTPAARSNAFRLGYFLRDQQSGGDLGQDHAYFQRALFRRFEEQS